MFNPLAQILDHATKAVQRLAGQFKESPLFKGMVSAIGDEVQSLENALYELLTTRDIDAASGQTLANIGRLVGAPPQGARSTSEFRNRIKTQIGVNRSDGSASSIYTISKLVVPAWDVADQPKITDEPHATYVVQCDPPGSVVDDYEAARDLARILREANPAGVHGIVISQNQSEGSSFCFDGGAGLGFGDGEFIGAFDGNQ